MNIESNRIENGEANVYLYAKNTKGVIITSAENWLTRLWCIITNPFRYIFTGRIRY